MTTGWEPEQYTDEYCDALENLIEEKIEHGDKVGPAPSKKKQPSNVVDLAPPSGGHSAEPGKGKSRQTGDESPSKVQAGAWGESGSMKGFQRENSLSLVLIALFVLFFAGQAVYGWLNYNDEQVEHYQLQSALCTTLQLEPLARLSLKSPAVSEDSLLERVTAGPRSDINPGRAPENK